MATYAIERLAALLSAEPPAGEVSITVFERTGDFGSGETHSDRQSPTSALNRVASQIAFAADESNPEAAALLPRALRPTFYEWASDEYLRSGDPRLALRPEDVPARCLHGLALKDMFLRYVQTLRAVPGVSVHLEAAEVTDMERDADSAEFRVHASAEGRRWTVSADQILLVTGHARRRLAPPSTATGAPAGPATAARYIAHPYPLHQRLDEAAVPPGCRVAVMGLGLTAIDAILYLTQGRGGTFADDAGRLRYISSGREPACIIGTSSSGMFTWCRPLNEKALDGTALGHVGKEHRAVFLTPEAVTLLRTHHGHPAIIGGQRVDQLDFDRQVFPLIVLELAWVYWVTALGSDCGEALREAARPAYEAFLRSPGDDRDAGVDALLAPLLAHAESLPRAERVRPFDWRSLFDPLTAPGVAAVGDWQSRLVAFVQQDNLDAAEGNLRNPVKAACDGVWRDLRAVLAQVVDFGGLTAASHRRFCDVYFRYYTRMSNGTGMEAMRKIQALLEAGLIDAAIGPEPQVQALDTNGFRVVGARTGVVRDADVLVEGRVPVFDPALEAGPLYPNLLRRGLIRHWRNPGEDGVDYLPGAVDLSRGFHPFDTDGVEDTRLTVLGAPVEGLAFFQLSAARPQSNSPILNNVVRWANTAIDILRAAQSPQRKQTASGMARGVDQSRDSAAAGQLQT